MAETLTFENTTETTSIENLNAEEQDSLQVGEQMQQDQEQLLAGKYKDAQELEQAYVELQKKLGEKGTEDTEPTNESEIQESEEVQDKETESEETVGAGILDTLWEESVSGKGEFSKETLDELSKLNTGQLAGEFLKWRSEAQNKYVPKQQDFTESDVKVLKDVAGGDKEYNSMLQWANQNLNPKEIEMFDKVMERGDPLAAFFAVRSLAYRYQDKSGFEGKMVTGKAPKSSGGDVFKSQAEVVRAMGDPRYDEDPAYRQEIQDKLERSNINF